MAAITPANLCHDRGCPDGVRTLHARHPSADVDGVLVEFDQRRDHRRSFAFGEEYGWRGYLFPRLLPLGELRASLLVGVIWAFWHAPALLAGLNYPGSTPWAAIVVFVIVVTAMSLIFTRFFVASGGSVLVVAVLHGSFNSFNDRLIGAQHMAGNPLVVSMGLVAGAVLVLTAVVIYALPRRFVSFH